MVYIDLLKKWNITPNHWISEEYFKKAGFNIMIGKDDNSITVWEKDQLVFPAIDINGNFLQGINPIWSDFEGYKDEWKEPKFLDYNYIYDPKNFLNLEGHKWAIFRKNIKKFPKRIGSNLFYVRLNKGEYEKEITELAIGWLSSIEEVHDAIIFNQYLFEGENRKILIDSMGRIYGLNIYDSNFEFINFRFAICGKQDFISEHLRYLFFTDPEILEQNKLVNDGGTLGSEKLEFFKNKLNPVSIRKVYSWINK